VVFIIKTNGLPKYKCACSNIKTMKYTIYDPTTGQILSVLTTADPVQAELNLAHQSYLLGDYSAEQYYVKNGQAVEKSPRPDQPSLHTFDYTTKTWQANLVGLEQQVRRQRNSQLVLIDRVNPVWYASLTADQQQDLVVYIQLLLDVPQQACFPTQVEWPPKPTWL
jgi:hypothetical protein